MPASPTRPRAPARPPPPVARAQDPPQPPPPERLRRERDDAPYLRSAGAGHAAEAERNRRLSGFDEAAQLLLGPPCLFAVEKPVAGRVHPAPTSPVCGQHVRAPAEQERPPLAVYPPERPPKAGQRREAPR